MEQISISQAAERLGVSERRVRQLAARGSLNGRRLGRSWIIDAGSLSRERRRSPGRPPSARKAWALLAMLSGDAPAWIVDAADRSRLRRIACDPERLLAVLRWSEPRARIEHLRFLPADIPKLRQLPGIVLSGASARVLGIDALPRPGEIDAYVEPRSLDALIARFRPQHDSAESNAILRLPSHDWVLGHGVPLPAVVAADMLLDDDPRVHRAGASLLQRLASDLRP